MWLKKLCQQLLGKPSQQTMQYYLPQTYTSVNDIFQSSDFPHVFLGGQDDLEDVQKLAGQMPCQIFDCRDLPEMSLWQYNDFLNVQQKFDAKVNQLGQIILTTKCPVFVHCAAGVNRSVSVLSAAISELTSKPLNSVLSEIKSKRYMIGPDDPYYLMALEHCSQTSQTEKQKVFQQLSF